MSADDITSRCIWAFKVRGFMWGCTEALDAGWELRGRVRRLAAFNATPPVPGVWGISLVFGRYLLSFYMGDGLRRAKPHD